MNAIRLAASVDFLSRTVDSPYSRRFSLDYRIGLVTRGSKKYTYRKRVLVADHNSIALAEPGEVHTGAPVREPFELRMLSLQPEALAEFVPQDCGYTNALPSFDKPVFSDRELRNLLTGLFDGIDRRHDPDCWKLYVDECLQSIVALLMARNTSLTHQEPLTRDLQAVQRAMSLIHDLYDKPLSLEDLARESGLPKYRFLRAFRAEVGLPPHRYQLHFRLEKAKRSIKTGTPLAEVALSSGFYDQSHFHRHFSSLIGISPHAYRLATTSLQPASIEDRSLAATTAATT